MSWQLILPGITLQRPWRNNHDRMLPFILIIRDACQPGFLFCHNVPGIPLFWRFLHFGINLQFRFLLPRLSWRNSMEPAKCLCKRRWWIIPISVAYICNFDPAALQIISGECQLTQSDVFRQTNSIHIRKYLLKESKRTTRNLCNFLLIYRLLFPMQVILNTEP